MPLKSDETARGARIAGIGAAVPAAVISGSELVGPFGKSAEWLRQRTGIAQVHRLVDGEDLVDPACSAASGALRDAGIRPSDIDVLIVATCSQDAARGPLSARVAARLVPHAVAFDLNAACAGFCYALTTARTLIMQGSARRVLVIGAEQMSRILDPADLGTSILFGDGAGAVVVVADTSADAIGPAAWSSEGEHADLLRIPSGSRYLGMNGQEVFRWAVDRVHRVARAACELAGIVPGDIDVFVPHQANLRIVEAMARKLGVTDKVIATDVEQHGNTSAASIPLALSTLRRGGRTRTGERALLVGFGAGLAVCAQVVRLP